MNFHYFLVILFSNKKINFLGAPYTNYKNYKIEEKEEELDFGYKGEVMLFGAKISS